MRAADRSGAPSIGELCEIVTTDLLSSSGKTELSAPLGADAAMGTVSEWDSLSFVAVFTGVAEALDLDLDEDDAIHFTSIEAMHDFLSELMAP